MYESRQRHPVSLSKFLSRLLAHFSVSAVVILFSLRLGMWGYEHYEGLPSRDAFLNAAMLLGGMGPVDPIRTPGGKLFAGWFALYAGLVFLAVAGLLLAPVVHRILHRFHWSEQ